MFCGWYCLTLSCFHDVTGSWGAAQELGGGSKQVCHQVSKSFMLLCCGQPWKNKCYSDIWLVTVNFSKLWLVNLISTCVQQYIQAQVPLLWYNIDTNNEFFSVKPQFLPFLTPNYPVLIYYFFLLSAFCYLDMNPLVKEKKTP